MKWKISLYENEGRSIVTISHSSDLLLVIDDWYIAKRQISKDDRKLYCFEHFLNIILLATDTKMFTIHCANHRCNFVYVESLKGNEFHSRLQIDIYRLHPLTFGLTYRIVKGYS